MDKYYSMNGTNEGFTERVERTCFKCKFDKFQTYQVQSDSGVNKFCFHPDVTSLNGEMPKSKGDSTPDWCPYLIAVLATKIRVQ